MESVEVTRDAVLGMSGPTFYYGQVLPVSREERRSDNILLCRIKILSRRSQRKIFRWQQLNTEIFNVKQIVILTDGLILVFICLNEEYSFNIRKVQEYVNCISFFSELKKCQLAGNN